MIYQQMEFDIIIHAANFENTLELNWPMCLWSNTIHALRDFFKFVDQFIIGGFKRFVKPREIKSVGPKFS